MPQDPKKQIEKLSRYAKNPQFASHSEKMEQTDHLEAIAENLKPTVKITSFIQHFLDEVKGETGDTGDKGDKGEQGIQGIQGIQGPKGDRGEQGPKGETGPPGQDGNDGKPGKKGDIGIPGRDGRDGKDGNLVEAKDVIEHLKSLKGNDRLDISHLRNGEHLARLVGKQKANDGDLRWHGGAPNFIAGTNITLTKSSNGANVTIASTGGGGIGTALVFTGSVNGSNQVFTTTGTVTYVISDGVWFQAKDNNSITQWAQVGSTVTLTIPPPINAIWGF